MKALTLVSGGLDSILAATVVKKEGVEVVPVYFRIPFCHRVKEGKDNLKAIEAVLGVPVQRVDISQEFLNILAKPRYGFGSNMNPCIDCKILMFLKAREMMALLGASFVVTGEVLAQRPMSQHRQALELIEQKSGLKGLLLRPLSAKLLDETTPEKEGWIKRENLLGFGGRTRRPQMDLAKSLGVSDYQNPAGGCLLTDEQFSRRLKDLIGHNEVDAENIELLKVGRHFRLNSSAKLVVARNEEECKEISVLAGEKDYLFIPAPEVAGPTCLGRGSFDKDTLMLAGGIALRYCDVKQKEGNIFYRILPVEEYNIINAPIPEAEKIEALRI